MDNTKLIHMIDLVAQRTGLKPETVCHYAFGQSRTYDTLKRASKRNASRAEKLREWARSKK